MVFAAHHNQCSQSTFTINVHNQCSQSMFTFNVHNQCSQSMFTINVHNQCIADAKTFYFVQKKVKNTDSTPKLTSQYVYHTASKVQNIE